MSNDEKPPTYEFAAGEFEWIEKAAIENLKGRIATADTLAKEAATTLTILLAGAGGSYAYAVKLFDEAATKSTVAALLAGMWLTFLAMLLVWRCLMIKPIPPVFNQPDRLLERSLQGESFEEWKTGELHNMQVRISRAVERNDSTAKHLNIVRLLATLTPILSLVGVWLFVQSAH